MKIILSKDNIEENLSRFVAQYDNVLSSVKRIGSADLRYPNGFAIRKSNEPIQKIDSGERPLI
jgi:cell division septal protein FtsQ